MKLLLVICALVACAKAATVYKMTSHLEITKELISSSDDDRMDFLEPDQIEQLTSIDGDQEDDLTKKKKPNNCRLCHQVVGFVIHHTRNHTSKEAVATTLKFVCHHVHRERRACNTFVGNYSMNITEMVVANKTSQQICNDLGCCRHRADDEFDQFLSTPKEKTLILPEAESNEDDDEEQVLDENSNGEIDYSQINTGGVEPDYDFHENRVGNDDSHDDNNDQIIVNYNELEPEHEGTQKDQYRMTYNRDLCRVCKVVCTSVLSKTTPSSTKLDIKKILDVTCRNVIPIFKLDCQKLLKQDENKIVTGIFNKHASKDICTIDLRDMCPINLSANDDDSSEYDDIFTHDADSIPDAFESDEELPNGINMKNDFFWL